MNHPASRLIAGPLIALALLVAACQPSVPGAQQPASQPPSQDLAAVQEFRFNLGSQPPTLDPQYSNFDASVSVLLQLFDGLLEFDEQLKPRPAVAREIPTLDNGGISRDAKTYTFRLRNDVKWSDGQPLTAKDFDYGIRRLFDPDKGAPYASFYYGIVGGKDYFSAKGTRDEPKTISEAELSALRQRVGVRAVDDFTLEVQLVEPRASFLQLAALWPMYPIRQDMVERHSDRWTDAGNLIGNGPFRMTEHVANDHITLVANEHFYGPKPKLTKISLRVVADANADYAAYLNGEVDAVRVPVPNLPVVRSDPELSKQLVNAPRLSTFALQFNNKMAPFDNQKVRQAFSQGFDREILVRNVEQGTSKPAYSWIPPGMPGHQPDLGKDVNKFDPAAGKRLLAEAGYPDGRGLPSVTLQYSNTSDNALRAQFFQAQFKENLGIDLILEPMESAAYSRLFTNNQHHIGLTGWGADYPDADNWLPDIFGTGAGSNHTQYSNPQVDDIMRRAIAEPEEGRRMQLWAQAQEMIVKDVPLAPFSHRDTVILVKPYVKGLKLTGLDGTTLPGRHFINDLWMAKQ